MKHVLLITMLALFVLSCKTKEEKTEEQEVAKVEIAYASYGDKIDDDVILWGEPLDNVLHKTHRLRIIKADAHLTH